MGTATKARSLLESISRDIKRKPTAAVVYGPPGIGKTEFAASVPGSVMLCDVAEDGVNTLKDSGCVPADYPVLPPVGSYAELRQVLRELASESHDFRSLAVDTWGGMERFVFEYLCNTKYGGDWGEKGFANFQRGYEESMSLVREILNDFDKLRHDRGMSVILIAHASVKQHRNPDGPDYDRWVPDLHGKTWGLTHKWADMVLFANYHTEVSKEGGKLKGKGGQYRVLYTTWSVSREAKNRHNLPDEIDMGSSGREAWANLVRAIKEGKKNG